MVDYEMIKELSLRITEVENASKDYGKRINSLEVNEQKYVVKNEPITPGIGCKVSYDQNGMITNTLPLAITDLPDIYIDSIIGLRDVLNTKMDVNTVEKTKDTINVRSNEVYATGVKINYDRNGFIISSSELLEEDIPTLSIDKIDGLRDIIESLKSISNNSPMVINDDITLSAGTYTKITCDSNGRVVSGSKLDINDIPIEITNRLSFIEEKLPLFAQNSEINELSNRINEKATLNRITPGTYSKVMVDSEGVVAHGYTLEKSDLPDISIDDIDGLRSELNNKATQNDIIDINESLSNITNSINTIGSLVDMKDKIENAATIADYNNLNNRVNSMNKLMIELNDKIPNDTILEQLDVIMKEISNLSGRLHTIEIKLNLL